MCTLFDTIAIALIISLDEEEHHSGWTMRAKNQFIGLL
jgi:hypothetical protein